MTKITDVHGNKSPLSAMFEGKVCGECGAEATVIQEDEERNEKFFCFEHSPVRFKEIWHHGNDQ